MEIVALIIICIIGFIIIAIIKTLPFLSLRFKFSKFFKYCDIYNYSFAEFYKNGDIFDKIIGVIYNKEMRHCELEGLFSKNNITPIALPKDSKVLEYIAVIDFPCSEECYTDSAIRIRVTHGGIRFFHFFSLIIKTDDFYHYRSYEKLYLGKDKGEYFYNANLLNGEVIDTKIRESNKDALLNLIEEVKYWNDGETVKDKYAPLIQRFCEFNKNFTVSNKSPCEVSLSDHANNLYVHLTQKYESNNINKLLSVSIFNIGNPPIDVKKTFREDEDSDIIFYTSINEYIKEEAKINYNVKNTFGEDFILPTDRLITTSDIVNEIINQSFYNTLNVARYVHQMLNDFKLNLIPLSEFEGTHGSMSIEKCVSSETGELTELCTFTNANGNRTFVAFSPFMGEITLEEIEERKNELYVSWEEEGVYFLCTKEIEKFKHDTEKDTNYNICIYEERNLKYLLLQINVRHDFEGYTFSFEVEDN